MEQQRRFFLLHERLQSSEIPKMLCRVVTNKYLPLENYAPKEPLSPTEKSHNPNDIIPSILPPPSKSTTPTDLIRNSSDTGLKATLAVLFGLETTLTQEKSVGLESKEINRYALSNPAQYFAKLMENELYASDVRELLASSSKRLRAYLVTGFLTTRETKWTFESSSSSTVEVGISAPVMEALGVPVPVSSVLPGLDPELGTSVNRTRERKREVYVEEEEIFAVAYSVVQLKRRFWSGTGIGGKEKEPRVAVLKNPVRARAKHMAYSGEGSDEEEVDDEYDVTEKDEGVDVAGEFDFEIVDEDEDELEGEPAVKF